MDIITQRFDDHLDTHTKMRNYIEEIRVVADICKNALDKGHKILFCGNGGSAADAQHLAAELVGRFVKERGNSKNVVKATELARQKGLKTVAFTGEGGGKLGALCDAVIAVPSKTTARIQEMHIMVGHIICEIVEEDYD